MRAFLEHLPDVAWVKDDRFRHRYVNRAYTEFFDIAATEVLGYEDFDFMPHETAQELRENDRQVLESGQPIKAIEEVAGADGIRRRWSVQKFLITLTDGRRWVAGRATDITESLQAEEELMRSEQNYRLLVEASPFCIHRIDRDGCLTSMNQAGLNMIGETDPQRIVGIPYASAVCETDRGRIVALMQKAFNGLYSEFEFQGAAGQFFRSNFVPIRDEKGDVESLLGITEEISDRVRATAEVAESRRLLEKGEEIGQFGSWSAEISRTDGLIWSDGACRIFGFKPDEFDGRLETFISRVDVRDRGRVKELAKSAKRNGKPYDMEYRIEVNGASRWVHQHADVECDSGGKPFQLVGYVQDITERRQTEEKIRASEERYRLVAIAARDPIWEIDCATGQVSWNERYDELFGVRPDETGDDWDWWTSRIRESERERVATSLKAALADGSVDHWSEDYHFRAANGEELLIHDRAFISRGEDGRPLRIVGTMRDQTPNERAMREREELIRDVQEAQRLESLGVLAGGIAHDFNNLLTSVLGNVSFVREEVENGSEHREILGDAEDAIKRAADLCRQLLAYAGKGRFVLTGVNLSSEVGQMVDLLRVSAGKNVRLELRLDPDLPTLKADQSQLTQVVMNLVLNASEAIGDGVGQIVVTTGQTRLDSSSSDADNVAPPLPDGDYVFLEVADSGAGMDDETVERIFEPFFTTKLAGRGLGLSAVQGIMRGHKGGLSVKSELGAGTQFRILLPITAGEMARPSETRQDSQSAKLDSTSKNKTVLLVDDEDAIRRLAGRILEKAGYRALLASDGLECLEVIRSNPNGVDLVILDLTMPRMDGFATFKALRSIDQEIPVLLASGHSQYDSLENFKGLNTSGFIQKPFSSAQLSAVIEEILSR